MSWEALAWINIGLFLGAGFLALHYRGKWLQAKREK